jgi:hypothetical protein
MVYEGGFVVLGESRDWRPRLHFSSTSCMTFHESLHSLAFSICEITGLD